MLTIPLLAALAVQTANPDFFALGHDQAQFARKLKDAGFPDLAETFCARAEQNTGLSEKEAATLRSVHLDLQIDLATHLKDPIEKKDKLKDLLKSKVDFIDAYPDSPEAKDAQQNLPEVYRQLGEAYANALQKTEDPSAIREMRTEGADVFSRGEGALSSSLETLNEKMGDPNLSEADVQTANDQLALARYNLGRTYYFHASLLGAGDSEGEKLYAQCIKTFDDFGLDYSDSFLNFGGMIFIGLSHKALGQNDEALTAFDDCIALADAFEPDKQGKSQVPEEGADIISSAVLQKMQLLTELKKPEDALATANQFFKVIKSPEKAEQGLPLLVARMNAEVSTGDTASANKTATLLNQLDPRGPFGAIGREFLGTQIGSGGSSLGVSDTLKIASSLAAKKDFETAIARCHEAAAAARQAKADPSELAAVFALQAACLSQLKRYDEAALSYDIAVETAPAAEKAADSLNSSIETYRLLAKTTKRDFYSKRADERIQQLASKYPKTKFAELLQLDQGRKLEAAEKYADAADFYLGISPDAGSYPEAQLSAGTCLYQETLRLSKDKDATAAKAESVKADGQLRKAGQVLSAAAEKTLDLDQSAKYKRSAQQARSTLGELFMIPGLGRETDALAVAQENEAAAGTDPDRLGEARSLRVRALTATGKLKEAKDFLEALIAKEPSSLSTAAAAGVLARNLDVQAAKAFQANAKSPEGEDLWKQAFRYYVLSIDPKLDEAAAAVSGEIEKVATRLYVMGLYFNNVPDRLTSFVGWLDHKVIAPEYWTKAGEFYEASLRSYPSLGSRVALARVYAFLERYPEAQQVYAKIIEDESLIDPSTATINKAAVAANPELLSVYLEFGAAQYEAARKTNDTNGLLDAGVVFDRIVRTAAKVSEPWWQARYLQAAAWMESGEYKKARLTLRDLQRNTSEDFDEGKYGLNKLFKKMLTDVERKVVDEGGK